MSHKSKTVKRSKRDSSPLQTWEQDSRKVLFAESPLFQFLFDSFPCEIIYTASSYGRHSGAYAFPKGSAYPKMFGFHITHIQETGLLPVRSSSKKHAVEKCSNDGGYSPLSYNNIFFAFVACGVGLIIAILHCVVECIYHACLNNSKQKSNNKMQWEWTTYQEALQKSYWR